MTIGHGFRRCSPAAGLLACLVVLAAPGIALVALQPGVWSAASVFAANCGRCERSSRGRPLATGWYMGSRRKMSPTQRRLVDEALNRLNARPDELEGAELISDAHAMLSPERRVEIDWGSLPDPCDPHSTTFRGTSMRVGNGVDTTSHATMKMTINVRSQRKRAQVENFASLLAAADPEPGTVVVDFGCGSGNLVLPLAHLFPALRFVGVDLKPKATELLQQRAAEANLTNVCCETTPIEAYHGPCDIALSLHACGPASDQVLCAALQHGAAFLISPCCVGKITPQSSVASLARNFRRVDQQLPGVNAPHRTRTISRRLTAANIDAKTFELLCQTADRSEGLAPDSMPSSALTPPICLPSRVADPTQAHFLRGRLCKSAVELDRVSWVRQQDAKFEVRLLHMWGLEGFHLSDMIVGWPNQAGRLGWNASFFVPMTWAMR